jgi:hypothetical protein
MGFIGLCKTAPCNFVDLNLQLFLATAATEETTSECQSAGMLAAPMYNLQLDSLQSETSVRIVAPMPIMHGVKRLRDSERRWPEKAAASQCHALCVKLFVFCKVSRLCICRCCSGGAQCCESTARLSLELSPAAAIRDLIGVVRAVCVAPLGRTFPAAARCLAAWNRWRSVRVACACQVVGRRAPRW